MNFVGCELDGGCAIVGGHRIRLAAGTSTDVGSAGASFELGIRPEFLELVFDGSEHGVPARITRVDDLGSSKIVTTAIGADTLTVRLAEGAEISDENCLARFSSRAQPALPRLAAVPETHGGPAMMKTENNRAWFLVLPVFALVAFSAIVPLDDRGQLLGAGHLRPR